MNVGPTGLSSFTSRPARDVPDKFWNMHPQLLRHKGTDQATLLETLSGGDIQISIRPHRMWLMCGTIAVVVNLVAAIAQVVLVVRRQSATDFSWVFLVGLFVVQMFWALFAFGHGLWVNLTAALMSLMFIVVLMSLKAGFEGGFNTVQEEAVGDEG